MLPFALSPNRNRSVILRRAVLATLLVGAVPVLHGQIPPPSTGGLAALVRELRFLGHHERVLMIGAHPDDEYSELLAVLARGMGVNAGYLALNRGEGGQNLIGSELGEALGLLRSEELLSARRIDGASQFFTRAYDFGFSKTLDDTWAHWPRDSILKDVIRIVRRFRPQVVVSVFTGTPRDGHGHHQAAGVLAREAFRLAGDSTVFPELEREEGLAPWTPRKLYESAWFNRAAATLLLPGGAVDPATGQTYHQIAMAGRSRHRSQGMGEIEAIGPSPVGLALVEDRTGAGSGSLFSGVDTSLVPPGAGPGVVAALGRYALRVDSMRAVSLVDGGDELEALTGRAAADLFAAGAALTGGPLCTGGHCALDRLPVEWREQLEHLARIRAIAADLLTDARASDARVVPGDSVAVTLQIQNGSDRPQVAELVLHGREGWPSGVVFRAGVLPPGSARDTTIRFAAPRDAPYTTPYFLRLPREGDIYRWPAGDREAWGEPFGPAPLRAALLLSDSLPPVPVPGEVTQRVDDPSRGEVRRPIVVVPRVDVKLAADTLLVPLSRRTPIQFAATLTLTGSVPVSGTVGLKLPADWPRPGRARFRLTRNGEQASFAFAVSLPAGLRPGRYEVRAVAEDSAGERYDVGTFTVDYPHIRPRSWLRPAVAVLVAAPLALPPVARIGYIRGAADRVPEALLAAGFPVEVLDSGTVARGDLSRYGAIVVGPRAYETDTTLVRSNGRLLDYARKGGLLLVQYQQYQFVRAGLAAWPITIARPHDRVTDEAAPVRELVPGSPVFHRPNPIGAEDWQGWVQERGLYFARTWDPAYTPLLVHDPGEGPKEGGLLVGRLGKGTYIYTGLAFFRELPAGVPGAFRLFANLLALAPQATP